MEQLSLLPLMEPQTGIPDLLVNNGKAQLPAPNAPGRPYQAEVLDRRTGELVTLDMGTYVTVTELGHLLGLSPRRIRKVLHVLDLAQPEGRGGNYRLTREAAARGLGKRIDRPRASKKGKSHPFDVISPEGQQFVRDNLDVALARLAEQRGREAVRMRTALDAYLQSRQGACLPALTLQKQTYWLADHFPSALRRDIAEALEAAPGVVRSYLAARERQQRKKQAEPLREPSEGPSTIRTDALAAKRECAK